MALSTSRNLTIAGILTLIGAVATAVVPAFDNDPATVVNWGAVVSLVVTGILGIMAKGASSTGGTVDAAGNPVGPKLVP